MRTRLAQGLALFTRTHAKTDKPPCAPDSSDLVPALRPAPRGVRRCVLLWDTASVTLTNVDFVNCMYAAMNIFNPNVTMTGAHHTGIAPLRARCAAVARHRHAAWRQLASCDAGPGGGGRRGACEAKPIPQCHLTLPGGSIKNTTMQDSSAVFAASGYENRRGGGMLAF